MLSGGCCHSSGPPSENKRNGNDKQIGLCEKAVKAAEHEGNGDTNCSWCHWNGSQRLGKRTREIGNQMKNQDHSDYSIVKIGQNSVKIPEGLKRLAVTPVEAYQQMLV